MSSLLPDPDWSTKLAKRRDEDSLRCFNISQGLSQEPKIDSTHPSTTGTVTTGENAEEPAKDESSGFVEPSRCGQVLQPRSAIRKENTEQSAKRGRRKVHFTESSTAVTARAPRAPRTMTEPRARAARHKGQLNFEAELKALLYAFGDDQDPLPETVRVLDEIVTDFIIETCHQAARSASYSNRQKIKIDDFKFAIRNNEEMLGRVQELLGMDKELKEARKQFDVAEGKAGLEKGRLTGEKGKRGKGRPPKGAKEEDEEE